MRSAFNIAGELLPLLAGVSVTLLTLSLIWVARRAVERWRLEERFRDPAVDRRRLTKRAAAVVAGTAGAILVIGALVASRDGVSSATMSNPAQRSGAGAPPEKNGAESENLEPKPVSVHVMNAAGVQGLAAKKADDLRRDGFEVRGTSTAPSIREESVILYKTGKAPDAHRVGAAIEIPSRRQSDQQIVPWGQKAGIVVVLGMNRG